MHMLQFIEGKKISEGGLPVGTGWQKEGLWVAMALSNFARTYLRLDEWLEDGKEISVKGLKTHYGSTEFHVKNKNGEFIYDIKTEREITKEIIWHLPG